MKKTITMIAFGLMGLSLSAQNVPNYVPTNGLVGWWPFNGNANDESGNNNNGTVNGATLTTDRFGNANSAYNFIGVNDNILIQNLGTNSNWSLNFWFETPISNNLYLEYLFGLGSNLNPLCNCTPGFGITGIDQQQPCQSILPDKIIFVDTAFSTCNVTYISNYSVSALYHYVITKSNLNYAMYQNGQLVWSSIGANINLDRLLVGKRFSNDLDYNGKIDDIGIWNRALTQQEITDLYNANICYQNITVTDTLLINTGITGFNPITYKNTIKVWPNPTNDHITIDNGNIANLTGYQIKITNSLSQQVFQSAITQQQFYVDLSTWTGNGIYFVHIIDGQGNTIDIKKIVLQ